MFIYAKLKKNNNFCAFCLCNRKIFALRLRLRLRNRLCNQRGNRLYNRRDYTSDYELTTEIGKLLIPYSNFIKYDP